MAVQRHFYVENGVGTTFVAGINLFNDSHRWGAVFQNDVHPMMQRRQHGDEWWIEDASQQGYVIVTKDLSIFDSESERQAVVASGARVIGFANAEYTKWEMIGAFSHYWDDIAEQLNEDGPWMLRVWRGTTRPRLVDLNI
jgi:hypothetical protein